MGILDLARENTRRVITRDDKYFKRMLYFFELRVPANGTQTPVPGSYLYPLVIPPTSLRMSEPFAVEKSFTLDGGLFVEENGILARELTVSGTTGFAPRVNKGQSDFDLILPGVYRWLPYDAPHSIHIDGQRLEPGATLALDASLHRAHFETAGTGGALVLALSEPPGPAPIEFYKPY